MSERRFTRLKASLSETAAKTRETVSRGLRQSLNVHHDSVLYCIDADYETLVRQWYREEEKKSQQQHQQQQQKLENHDEGVEEDKVDGTEDCFADVPRDDIQCVDESKCTTFDFHRYYPSEKTSITSAFGRECIQHYIDPHHLVHYRSQDKYFGSVFDTTTIANSAIATSKSQHDLSSSLSSSKNFLSGFTLRPHVFECDEEEYDSVHGQKMLIREGSASVVDEGEGDLVPGWLTLSKDDYNCFLTFYDSARRDKIFWHLEINRKVTKLDQLCFQVNKHQIHPDQNYLDDWIKDINSNILAEFSPEPEVNRILGGDIESISEKLKSHESISSINLFAAYQQDLNARKGSSHPHLRDDINYTPNKLSGARSKVFRFCLSIKSHEMPDRAKSNDSFLFRISLFDSKLGKLSEEFRYVVSPDLGQIRPSTSGSEQGRAFDQRLMSMVNRALFQVDLSQSSSNDLYLVLRVERTTHKLLYYTCQPIVQGSTAVANNNNNKAPGSSLVTQHAEPYAWSIRPLFHPDSLCLETSSNFGLFYKMDQSRLTDEFILNILNQHAQSTSRSQTTITGKLEIDIFEYKSRELVTSKPPSSEEPQEVIFSSSLFPHQTLSFQTPITPLLEVQSLRLPTVPFQDFFNLLYIYPQSLKFDSQKVFSKARNLAVTVEIRDTDDMAESKPLRVIFGRPHDSSLFVTSATTAISKHNVTPDYFEEVKVALPLSYSDKLHVRFTLSHLSCKKDQCSYSVVGYAWLALSPEKRPLHCQNVTLSVFASLPNNYLSCQSLGLGKGLSMPDVKFVGKDLLRVSLVLTSSIISRDFELQTTLQTIIKITRSNRDDSQEISQIISLERQIPKMLRTLVACSHDELVHFSQIIFQQLFKLLVYAASQELIQEALTTIIALADKFRRDPNLLYLLHQFIETTFHTSEYCNLYIHDQLVSLLKRTFMQLHSQNNQVISPDEIKILLQNLWFLLQITSKSMVQYLFVTGRIKLRREERFDEEFTLNLKVFLDTASYLLATYSRLEEAQAANQALAYFLTRLSSYFDRSVVFNAFHHHVNILSSRDVLIQELKLNSIATLLAHEHYVPHCNPKVLEDTFILTSDFCKRHFPAYLMLSEFKSLYHHSATTVRHVRQISLSILRNQLAKHMLDERYGSNEARERTLSLYLPIISVILENTNRMFDQVATSGSNPNNTNPKNSSPFSTLTSHHDHNSDGTLSSMLVRSTSEVSSTLSSMASLNSLTSTTTLTSHNNQTRTNSSTVRFDKFSPEEIRDLFICLLAVVQVLDQERMNLMSKKQLRDLFLALECALNCFEYRPRKITDNRSKTMPNVIPGSLFATGSSNSLGSLTTLTGDCLTNYLLQQNLSIQSALITLRTIHLYLDNDQEPIDAAAVVQILSIYLTLMSLPQSQSVLIQVFNSVRYFLRKFSVLFFHCDAFLSPIIGKVIRYCNSSLTPIRQAATDLLYCLFHTNLKRTRFETIVCVSRLASSDPQGLLYLHSSLNRIEQMSQVDFPPILASMRESTDSEEEEVSIIHIVGRIREILKATKQIREEYFDPYLASELRLQLANSYARTSRSLLRTWLENLSEVHIKNKDWAEAALCQSQVIAILIKQLASKDIHITDGMLNVSKVSQNIFARDSIKRESDWLELEESHVSIDVLDKMIGDCVELLEKSELFELAPHVLKVMIPIFEKEYDHKKLCLLYTKMAKMHSKAQEINDSGKRIFDTFFRVAFYYLSTGQKQEYIYKVPKVVSLAEMTTRMQSLYPQATFLASDSVAVQQIEASSPGLSNVTDHHVHLEMNGGDVKSLSNFIVVITHVTPYVESARNTFEKNVGVQQFVYEQRLDAKIAQSVADQYKKRVILTAANSFPYFLKRIPVVSKQELVLSPIEVAIDEMQERVHQLEHVIGTKDAKHLQLVLQGSVNATVNCGPVAYANAFLKTSEMNGIAEDDEVENQTQQEEEESPSFNECQKHLKFLFEQFLDLCECALKLNEKLIKPNQYEYHNNLKTNFEKLRGQLDFFQDRHTSIQIFDVISGSTFA